MKKRIELVQGKIREHKAAYNTAMKHLEVLNERMHESRARSASLLALPTPHMHLERRAATPDIIRPHSHHCQREAQTPDLTRRPEILNHVLDQSKVTLFISKEPAQSQESSKPTLSNVHALPVHGAEEEGKSECNDDMEVRKLVEQCLKQALTRYQDEKSPTTMTTLSS